MAAEVRPPSKLAYAALICAIAAPLVVTAGRWISRQTVAQPGDDTGFTFMMVAPVLSAVGLVIALIARRRERNGVVNAALWICAIWLALIVFGVGGFFATYTGR